MKKEKIELFVPGRLCLFGEHSDWAGVYRTVNSEILVGKAIVTGIEQGIHAFAEKANDFMVEVLLKDEKEKKMTCPMDDSELKRIAKEGVFFSYVAGVASYVKEHYDVQGIRIVIDEMTLPVKRGLSSSAAICVLVARAFNRLYDLHMSTIGEMQAAYRGELRTPSKCGRLDQACAFGTRPILMEFNGNDIQVDRLYVKGDFYWVFADLCASKDTVRILNDLHKCYPIAKDKIEEKVHEALGVDNHYIINKAIECLQKGDAFSLGKVMTEAQCIFDEKVAPASEEELKAQVLHAVLNDAVVRSLTFGGKGVGSQGDGTVQFLAKDKNSQKLLVDYLKSELGMEPFVLTLKQQRSVRKAIIPVAGFGTRVYPETRIVKKEFLPVIDNDGLLKPAILVLLEELDSAGIDEICLVISEQDKPLYENFFRNELTKEHMEKLPEVMRRYEKRIISLGEKLHYVIQTERKGFGHAVFLCREFANREPVLLLLGDTLYNSFEEHSCVEQLIDAFERTEALTIGLVETQKEKVSLYGVMNGEWQDSQMRTLKITKMIEKPSVRVAEQELMLELPEGRRGFLSVFGNYVLTSEVFDSLEGIIQARKEESAEEIQLTDAINDIRMKYGIYGYRINGEAYDIGNPDAYRKTVAEFGR